MSDLTTTQIFAAGEKNITATKMNNIIGGAVIQPDFYANKPTASSVNPTDQLLILSGGAYAQAPFSTVVNAVGASMTPQITAVRLRSFNALQNSTFEVDQRNVATALTNPANTAFLQDRWQIRKSALTGTVNTALQDASTAPIVIPGTSFGITSKFQRFTVGTAQASLAAGDFYFLRQSIEGPRWRELASDVHSVSVLARSSVANLAFSLSLQDSATANSLVKTCTLGSANTWLLIQLPNLPVWSGTYSAAPGQVGYFLQIALAVGTTFSAAASSAWQAANILGVTGNSNFLATAGATFDLAFLQHEPGAQCTTPIDCSFQQNYDDCLRYFQKTYDYGIVPATVTSNGVIALVAPGPATVAHGSLRFFKPMAKTPVMTMYNWATGAANSVRDAANTDHGSVAASNLVSTGFSGISFTTATAAANGVYVHYTADTGW